MNAMPLMVAVLVAYLWIFRYRLRERFIRAYGLFFLILLIFASNKEYYGISATLSESTFSPLSLMRWGLLGWLVLQSWRVKPPPGFAVNLPLPMMATLLIGLMLLSGLHAEDTSYSMMRAASFALLTFALMRGLAFYLHNSVNCLRFFQFHYYTAWIALAPFLLLLFSGTGYGVTIIMGQYAGFFGNQNTIGAISAFLTPYVLFHWQVVAVKRWQKIVDLALLAVVLTGVWLSGSRNGTICTILGIVTWFFIVNLQSRLKIIVAGVLLLAGIIFFPSLQNDLTRFVRKGTDKSAAVTDLRTQLTEERRYEMWTGVWPRFWERKMTGYGFAQSHLLVHEFTNDHEAGRSLHNSYLEIFGDLGLPGLVLLGLIIWLVALKSIGIITQRTAALERQISGVFIAGFVIGSFNAVFESWMFSVGNLISLLYWTSVTGIVARTALQTESVADGVAGPGLPRPLMPGYAPSGNYLTADRATSTH